VQLPGRPRDAGRLPGVHRAAARAGVRRRRCPRHPRRELAARPRSGMEVDVAAIQRATTWVTMRDGIRLATDLYLPPVERAPAAALRTPYGKSMLADTFVELAQRGFVVIAQDCRGTGDSEPDEWEFSIYEPEDCLDFVEWVTEQPWYDGFLGSCGGS